MPTNFCCKNLSILLCSAAVLMLCSVLLTNTNTNTSNTITTSGNDLPSPSLVALSSLFKTKSKPSSSSSSSSSPPSSTTKFNRSSNSNSKLHRSHHQNNSCQLPSKHLRRIRSAEERKEALVDAFLRSYHAYINTGWGNYYNNNFSNSSSNQSQRINNNEDDDSQLRLPIRDPAATLAAMNTLWIMNLRAEYLAAKALTIISLSVKVPGSGRLAVPPTELFPDLVTAFLLTEDRFFLGRARAILHSTPLTRAFLLAQWPLETASLLLHLSAKHNKTLNHYFEVFERLERSGDRLTIGLGDSWQYMWMQVNLHRFSHFTYIVPIDYLNAWLTQSDRSRTGSATKLFTTTTTAAAAEVSTSLGGGTPPPPPALQYVARHRGEGSSANCAWGAVLTLASVAALDSVAIGGRRAASQSQLATSVLLTAWTAEELLAAGLAVTETCRLAGEASPYRGLPLRWLHFGEAEEKEKKVGDKKVEVDKEEDEEAEEEEENLILSQADHHHSADNELHRKTWTSIVNSGIYDLGPELALAYFTAYRVTKDPVHREHAWAHFAALEDFLHCHIEEQSGRFAAAAAAASSKHHHHHHHHHQRKTQLRDRLESSSSEPDYSLLATGRKRKGVALKRAAVRYFGRLMRYLYLTLDSPATLPLQQFVFSARGNPLKILEKYH